MPYTAKTFIFIIVGHPGRHCAAAIYCMHCRTAPPIAPSLRELSAKLTEGVYRRNKRAMPGSFHRKSNPSVGEGLAPPAAWMLTVIVQW